MFSWPQASPVPAQLPPAVHSPVVQESQVLVSHYGSTNASHQGGMKSPHVHSSIPYPRGLAFTNNVGSHGYTTATRPVYPPSIVGELDFVPGAVDWFTNPANPAAEVDQIGAWPTDQRLEGNIAPHLGGIHMVDISGTYGMKIKTVPYIRRTKTGRKAPVRAPPQAFEGDPDVLAARLIFEGADPDAVDTLRRWIFVAKVTEQELKAPIESRELSLRHGGVRVKWHLLLQVTGVIAGEQSYCCRLCPLEHRPEYKNERDVLRHLKRDHFGFSVACQYW